MRLGPRLALCGALASSVPSPFSAGGLEARGDAAPSAEDLARLAEARDRTGDYEGAAEAFRAARERAAQSGGGVELCARLDLARASALARLGKGLEAGALARAVLRNGALPRDLRVRARVLFAEASLARARLEPRHLEDALRALRTAERELESPQGRSCESARERALTQAVSVEIAEVLRRQAKRASTGEAAQLLAEAIRRLEAALQEAYSGGDTVLAAVAAADLGVLYLDSGKLELAQRFVDWAHGRARAVQHFETEWRCRWYRARLADARGDSAAADSEYALAAALVDAHRSRILDADAKRGFMADKLDLYRDLVRRELGRGRSARAFELAERARARALVESLGCRLVTLAAKDSDLFREFVALTQGGAANYDGVRARVSALCSLVRESPRSSPALRSLVDGTPATATEVSRYLPDDATLVEYFSTGEAVVAFVVARGEVSTVEIPAGADEVYEAACRFAAGHAGDEALARRLHDLVIAPVAPRVATRRVVIVPCGALARVPFEALRGPEGILLVRWTVSYLPSASLARYLLADAGAAGGAGAKSRSASAEDLCLLAIADPQTDYDGDGRPDRVVLPHARAEVARFAPRFRERVVLSGAEAREAALIELARRQDVIHFACHGEFDAVRPWESALFLAPGPSGAHAAGAGVRLGGAGSAADGRLRALEVYALDLRGTRLVVLSGCETGRSESEGVDDPVGIATSFLHAGASSLLASLWRVEDAATAELMAGFYHHWIAQGMDRAQALQRAKLALLRGAYPHPRQWAAFVAIGAH